MFDIKEFKFQMGKELKKLRVQNELTLEEAAEKSKVYSTTISKYERGEIKDFNVFSKLLIFYNVNYCIFFDKVYANMQ